MEKQYKLGVALSGGGAKGAAHCGVLQALHEHGLDPEIMAGTSVGSIVGSLYCAGVKPVDMCNKFIDLDFTDLMTPTSALGVMFCMGINRQAVISKALELHKSDSRKKGAPIMGLFDQAPLINYLKEFIPVEKFEDLTIPFTAVACDLNRGSVKEFNSGELAPRIMASCSLPLVFKPTVVDGVPYVDGGVYKNLPVSVLRDQCEKVIAISVHATPEEYKQSLFDIGARIFHMMLKANTFEDSKYSDLYIELDTKKYSQFDLNNIEELFRLGYRETVNILENMGYPRVMPPEKLQFKQRRKTKKIGRLKYVIEKTETRAQALKRARHLASIPKKNGESKMIDTSEEDS